MAENQTPPPNGATSNGAAQGAQNQQNMAPSIRILAQYIKDLSFENPGMSNTQSQPNIEMGIDVGATAHEDGNGIYEVSLRIQGNATVDGNTLFVIELDYSAMFQLQGFRTDELEAILLIECPRLIFPFARRILADVTQSGGFPPLLVDPIDFRNLYTSQKQRQQQEQNTGMSGPMSAAIAPQNQT